MRQLRRGAPFGWLLTLLFPLLVAVGGGQSGSAATAADATALPRHALLSVTGAERHPLSRGELSGQRQHDLAAAFAAALVAAGAGAGGGHPVASPPPGSPHRLTAAVLDSRPAGEPPGPLASPLVSPARAPPSTGV
ncbi:hypothetical protein GCM10017600_45890 [Streptosporangium carneum]|uniref:Uncharacterized protein n=2 Tax=Streptosporangium carneum TaxID=47481 RepID=A0A9W6I4U0_9ACTN|nr:hypothetical protein GCM10017600_45890 [Streptosporangium carneum]